MLINFKIRKNRYYIVLVICATFLLAKNSFAQSTTTVYTPNGSPVTVLVLAEMSQSQISATNAQAAAAFPNATIISNSSSKYNCHAYAWYMTECPGCPPYWMNTPGDDKYWQDCSYIEVSAAQAQKISYASDDHSAVKSVVSGKYESKWGAWPVMRHSPTDTPYNSTNLKYYLKPSISGPSSICSTASFNVTAPTGSNIGWTVTPSNAGTFSGGSSSTKTFTRSSNFSGPAIITATLSAVGGCGNLIIDKTVNIGAKLNLVASRRDGMGGVSATVTGGSGTFKWYRSVSNTSPKTLIYTSSTSSVQLQFGCASGVLTVENTGSCGFASAYTVIYGGCYNSFAMSISPNPSSSEIFIDKIVNEKGLNSVDNSKSLSQKANIVGKDFITAELYDSSGNLRKRQIFQAQDTRPRIDVSEFRNGNYFLKIIGKEIDEIHQVIIE